MNKEEILTFRKAGETYDRIGRRFGVTKQRIHQIITGYNSYKPHPRISPPTTYKPHPRISLLTTDQKPPDGRKHFQGKDYARECARIRDKHTCQKCGRVWQIGERRFDVHHLNGLCGKMTHSYDSIKSLALLITYCHRCHLNLDEVKIKMRAAQKTK